MRIARFAHIESSSSRNYRRDIGIKFPWERGRRALVAIKSAAGRDRNADAIRSLQLQPSRWRSAPLRRLRRGFASRNIRETYLRPAVVARSSRCSRLETKALGGEQRRCLRLASFGFRTCSGLTRLFRLTYGFRHITGGVIPHLTRSAVAPAER